jgi:Holliday junction resolvase
VKEQDIQKKVIMHLTAHGFVVIKIITANRAGVFDVIACAPNGHFWACEVKTEIGRTSKLQEAELKKLLRNNAAAFIAYGYEDYLEKFDNRAISHPYGNKPFVY